MNFNIEEISTILFEKLDTWYEALISNVPNAIVAILIIIAFAFISGFARKLTRRGLRKVSDKIALNNLASNVVRFGILTLGVLMALKVLQLDGTVKSLLAGAGIVGLALGFAFQDIAANFMAGILMAIRRPIQVGDIIESNDYMGVVEKIDLRVTTIRTFQGIHVMVPNKDVFQNPLQNYTKTDERRIDLNVGVSYGDDLRKVKEITEKTIKSLSFLIREEDVALYFEEFGGSSINFRIVFWIKYPGQKGYLDAKSEAIMAIQEAFNENDITIPFPIRTLDFGIKGGEKLSEMNLQAGEEVLSN